MSITQGIVSGGSWSGSHTEQAFPRDGLGYTSLGRGNLNLVSFATNRQLAMSLVLLGLAGPIGSATKGLALRGLNVVTKPVFWAGVNAYHEAEDAAAWVRGEDMSWQIGKKMRPIRHPVFGYWGPGVPAIPVPFPYLDFSKSPSSGVGGPGEIPNLHRPPPSIEETGEILSNPPMVGQKIGSPRPSTSKKGRKSRKRSCPPGHYWDSKTKKCRAYAGTYFEFDKSYVPNWR